ncbi:MAG: hypothetical protein U1E14_10290 [Geminicoccaceae bacterium]
MNEEHGVDIAVGAFDRRDDSPRQLAQSVCAALRRRIGEDHFDRNGRLKSWTRALVPGVDASLLPPGVQGTGTVRLREPESPTVIALNSFVNWRAAPAHLRVAGEGPFTVLRFEARCPTGIRGTPPLLDLIAAGDAVVAVASRGIDYLSRRQGKLADAYDGVRTRSGLTPWIGLLQRLRGDSSGYRYVDAPAVLKYALGLGQTFPSSRIKLVYLYWEPADAALYEPFRAHRAELQRLVDEVAGSTVTLVALSFDELWAEWAALPEPAWLRGIVAALRERYAVVIGDDPAL